MILYHGTSTIASKSIIEEGKINPSIFSLSEYIQYIITNYEVSIDNLPSFYKVKHMRKNVYWLGNGIYGFGPSDYNLAKTWRTRYGKPRLSEEECSVIQFEINDKIAIDCFDFTAYRNRQEVKRFYDEYMAMVDNTHEGKLREKLLVFLSIVKDAFVSMDYKNQEHLLGLAIEMFIMNIEQDIPFLKATFEKETDTKYFETYYAVRDNNLVKNIEEVEEVL